MRVKVLLANPKTGKQLRFALLGTWCISGLLAGIWGFQALRDGSLSRDAAEQAKSLKSRIADASRSIERARGTSSIQVPRGLSIIDAFQAEATRIASGNGCALTEFQATPQLSAYLSRFQKDTPKVDWVQVDVNATIRGAAPNVIEALKSLADCGVPFEFNTVDFRRNVTANQGGVQVTCTLSLRLVTHNDGGHA